MGKIVREVRVASEPEALLQVLSNPAYHFKRIGLEASPLSQWLFSALAEAGLPVICVETRHMRAVLKSQINKTDRNDARGIAQMMRAGVYRSVHVKTLRSQKLRMLLTHRDLQRVENVGSQRVHAGKDHPDDAGKGQTARGLSAEHIQLVPEHQDFGFQLGPRPEEPSESAPDQLAKVDHRPRASTDLRRLTSRTGFWTTTFEGD